MATGGHPKAEKLPLSTRIFSGIGTTAFGIKDQGFGGFLMLYYNQVLGLPAAWVGTAIMIAMVADAFFDPIVGHVSDQCRSRWGRRHPFMYAAALPLAVFYFLLWSPPALSPAALSAYLLVTAILVRFALSIYEIPSMALLSELSSDYDERTALVAWRYFFGTIGGIGITIIAFRYFLVPTAAQPVGQLNAAGYHEYAIVASILMLIFVLAAALGTHNRIPQLRIDAAPQERAKLSELGSAVRDVFGNRVYLVMLGAMLLLSIAAGLNSALGIYVNTYFWQLNSSAIATLTTAAMIGVLLAFLVALPLSKKLGKKRGALILFLFPLMLVFLPVFARLGGVLPLHSPLVIPILTAQAILLTACAIGGSILLVSMISDVTDHVRLDTGRKSEGLLFSLVVLINKAISGLGVLFGGMLLSAVGFPAKAQPGKVPEHVVDAMVISFVALYFVFALLGILSLIKFPITRESHEDALARLDATAAGALHEPVADLGR